MAELLEFLANLLELISGWRFFLCFIPAVITAALLHHWFNGSVWPWFVSVPLVFIAIVYGLSWQIEHRRR